MSYIPSSRGSIIGSFLVRVVAIFLFAGLCAVLYALYAKNDDAQTRARLEEFRTNFRARATDVGDRLGGLNDRLNNLYEDLRGADGETTGALALRIEEMRERLGVLQEQVGDITSQEKWQEYRQALEDLYRVASMSLPGGGAEDDGDDSVASHPEAEGILHELRSLIQDASSAAPPEGEGGEDDAELDGPSFGGER